MRRRTTFMSGSLAAIAAIASHFASRPARPERLFFSVFTVFYISDLLSLRYIRPYQSSIDKSPYAITESDRHIPFGLVILSVAKDPLLPLF